MVDAAVNPVMVNGYEVIINAKDVSGDLRNMRQRIQGFKPSVLL